jgi:menaquinone-dependent protoporphyrinogen oxidase
VSLSAVQDFAKREAQVYVDRFLATTQWKPQKILLLGGAMRSTKYDYFQRQIVKYIVMKGGEPPDMDHDYEFTDWNHLICFVDEFLAAAETRKSLPRR